MTHAVIVLAAGVGRRLGVPGDVPKWLAPLGATVPAELQLQACLEAPTAGRVTVVAGHGLDKVTALVEGWQDRLDVRVLDNPHHRDRNNWYSLLLGLDAVDLDGGAGVYVLNSDLCAASSWFVTVLADLDLVGGSGLAIDLERPLTDEAMKVSVDRGGRLTDIGKVGVVDPVGEYVGALFLDADTAAGLRDVLRSFLDHPDRVDAWYEHGIQAHLRAGVGYRAVATPSSDWVEVDTPEDLALARGILADVGD